jgi:hypothetical protein
MKGRTTLVIAHRLATVLHADQILVLEAERLQVEERIVNYSIHINYIKEFALGKGCRRRVAIETTLLSEFVEPHEEAIICHLETILVMIRTI